MEAFDKTATDLIEGMALKIVMIEPGDLSVVGEILSQMEWLLATKGVRHSQHLLGMVKMVQGTMEKIVMNDLPDSVASYEGLGECIGIMQETARKNGVADSGMIARFCDHLKKIGFSADPVLFPGSAGASAQTTEEDLAFLRDRDMAMGFVDEAREHLATIDNTVIAIEQKNRDSDTINRILRAFHSIKGIAQCLDIRDISELSHGVESLLAELRSGHLPFAAGMVDVILRAADYLRHMVDLVDAALHKGPAEYEKTDITAVMDAVAALLVATKPVQAQAAPALPKTEATTSGQHEPDEERDLYQIDFKQDKDLLSGFIEESTEHLETIEVTVLDLEQNPNDIDIINKIFRPFHTIKGVSGFLNLKAINKLAHSTENLLDDVRNGGREMSPEIIDVVLGVGDCLKSLIKNIRKGLEQGPDHLDSIDIQPWMQRITAIREGGAPKAATPVSAETHAAGLAAAPTASAVGQESRPAASVAARPAHEDSAVRADDDTGASPPQVVAAEKPARPDGGSVAGARDAAGATGQKGQKFDSTIKVSVDKLDLLVNAVGELVIMLSLVQENPLIRSLANPKLAKDFSQLSRITSELQKTSMAMRMVPISQTFQKMIRLVRDLSKKSGKKVDLHMEGEETEIDRNMVDSIYDPLVHMIRNSVDHGVQLPEERVKQGKPESGTVNLRAYQRGGNMVIEIEDDGNGLNPLKIRAKAIERGLLQSNEEMSDHDLNNLIFLPGFSTADKITDVSGRGVGMDVVKKTVEKLRGRVEVVSAPGKGSTFVIRLPLTLAIIDGIIVRVGTDRYIIPTIAIQESLKPAPEQYTTIHNRGEALLIRENLVPIVRLYETFNVMPTTRDPFAAIMVVIENEGERRALMVDEVLGKQEVVIKNLGGLTDIKGVAGGTILGDGRVGLILDLAGLISGDSGG